MLFRVGYHSDQLEVELARRKIPFHKYGGLKFIEAAHVKDMLAFLRILENPYDEVSWFRVLLLLDGIGPAAARRIVAALGVRGYAGRKEPGAAGGLTPVRKLLQKPPPVPAGAGGQFDEFRSAVRDCVGASSDSRERFGSPPAPSGSDSNWSYEGDPFAARAGEPPLVAQVERLRMFYDPIFKNNYDNAAMRSRDLEQLEQVAAGYKSRGRFVSDLTLDPPTSTSNLAGAPCLEEDYLTLSTIHSAKGCEWDVVYVLHAADGCIPSDMALSDQDGIEEERRLFYVAMTRAKDSLLVYFPLRYYRSGSHYGDHHHYAQLTRFITPQVRELFAEELPDVPREEWMGAQGNPRKAPPKWSTASSRISWRIDRRAGDDPLQQIPDQWPRCRRNQHQAQASHYRDNHPLVLRAGIIHGWGNCFKESRRRGGTIASTLFGLLSCFPWRTAVVS